MHNTETATAVAIAITVIALILAIHRYLVFTDTVGKAFPNLPEEFREDLETSMTLAPVARQFDSAGPKFLSFIRYPYLDIEQRSGYAFDNEVKLGYSPLRNSNGSCPKRFPVESFRWRISSL